MRNTSRAYLPPSLFPFSIPYLFLLLSLPPFLLLSLSPHLCFPPSLPVEFTQQAPGPILSVPEDPRQPLTTPGPALSTPPPPVLTGPAGTPQEENRVTAGASSQGDSLMSASASVPRRCLLTLGSCQASELFYLRRWQASDKSFPYKKPRAPKLLTAPALTDGSQNSPDQMILFPSTQPCA